MSAKAQRREPERARQQDRRGGITAPPLQDLEAYARTQPYLTAYSLSERFGLRLSAAKDALESLARRGVLNLVAGSSRIRIYAPSAPIGQHAAAVSAGQGQEAEKKGKKRQAAARARKREQPSS